MVDQSEWATPAELPVLASANSSTRGLVSPKAPSGADVVVGVLEQFALNFVLNESPSRDFLAREVGHPPLRVPGHEPRRRQSVVEQVHQARVGVRRIRSTLRTFKGLLDEQWSDPMMVELSWFGGVLGASRDLDVMRNSLATSVRLVDDLALRSLVTSLLDQSIKEVMEQAGQERSSKRYADLVSQVARLGRDARFNDEASKPAFEVLAPQLERTWSDVRKARRDASNDPTKRSLHKLRIELKRLQYGCETVALVEGKPVMKLARAAQDLQTRLGSFHDESVIVAWLEQLTSNEPSLAGPLTDLVTMHQKAGKNARRQWRDDMERIERSWRRWHEFD